jgi:hypothetical protein
MIPTWRPIGESVTPVLGSTIGGIPRAGGFNCVCYWERTGYKELNPTGGIKENSACSIFDREKNIDTTTGIMTQSGCNCPNPSGEFQPK